MKTALDADEIAYEANFTVAQLLPLYQAIPEERRIAFEMENII